MLLKMTAKPLTKTSMMHLICKTLVVLFLVTLSWSPAYGQDAIQLFTKGTTLTLTEDLHCMNNATALAVSKKLKLCPEKCSLKLEELQKLYEVDLKTLTTNLDLQKKKYLEIISEKDKTVDKIQVAAIDEVSKIEGSIWWKVTLGVVGGLAAGIGATYLVMEYAR